MEEEVVRNHCRPDQRHHCQQRTIGHGWHKHRSQKRAEIRPDNYKSCGKGQRHERHKREQDLFDQAVAPAPQQCGRQQCNRHNTGIERRLALSCNCSNPKRCASEIAAFIGCIAEIKRKPHQHDERVFPDGCIEQLGQSLAQTLLRDDPETR